MKKKVVCTVFIIMASSIQEISDNFALILRRSEDMHFDNKADTVLHAYSHFCPQSRSEL